MAVFVAPPTPEPPPGYDGGMAFQAPVVPRRRSGGFGIAILALVVLALLGYGAYLALHRRDALAGAPEVESPRGKTVAPAGSQFGASGQSDANGLFEVRPQREQQPIVAIQNSSGVDLRLTMEDQAGDVQSEVVPAGTSKDLTIVQGRYTATVDAPQGSGVWPSDGTLDVKDFHHYQAVFVLSPSNGEPSKFYIGD